MSHISFPPVSHCSLMTCVLYFLCLILMYTIIVSSMFPMLNMAEYGRSCLNNSRNLIEFLMSHEGIETNNNSSIDDWLSYHQVESKNEFRSCYSFIFIFLPSYVILDVTLRDLMISFILPRACWKFQKKKNSLKLHSSGEKNLWEKREIIFIPIST